MTPGIVDFSCFIPVSVNKFKERWIFSNHIAIVLRIVRDNICIKRESKVLGQPTKGYTPVISGDTFLHTLERPRQCQSLDSRVKVIIEEISRMYS